MKYPVPDIRVVYTANLSACDDCGGRGWHYSLQAGADSYDVREVYCDCPAGKRRYLDECGLPADYKVPWPLPPEEK